MWINVVSLRRHSVFRVSCWLPQAAPKFRGSYPKHHCFLLWGDLSASYHYLSIPLIGGSTNLAQKKVAYSDTGNSVINLCVADNMRPLHRPSKKIAGFLWISGFDLFHSPTVWVLINSAGEVMEAAIQSLVDGWQLCTIASSNWLFR